MLTKIYLEITNVCNLHCSFCHGTKRAKGFMSREDFCRVLEKIKGKSKYLYLHLLGEPMLHPLLPTFCAMAKEAGFEVMLTTNGTKVKECGNFVFSEGNVKKISISLQAAEFTKGENASIFGEEFDKYLSDIAVFSQNCAKNDVICVLRLWNIEDGVDNSQIHQKLHELFPGNWIKNRSGYKLFDVPKGEMEVYLEYGEKFEWPDKNAPERKVSFCYALRDQIGILCDGTVVPCCLDADGEISLGNIFEKDFDEILSCERAKKLAESFEKRQPCEKLCKSCGYAQRFE